MPTLWGQVAAALEESPARAQSHSLCSLSKPFVEQAASEPARPGQASIDLISHFGRVLGKACPLLADPLHLAPVEPP
jgi:hypothetical protein